MPSFGENLRRERELRGVSLRDIADATKISVRFLDAPGKGRHALLPGGLFVRAFVKQYARHLGLDVDRTVADFLYAYPDAVPEKPPVPPPPRAPFPRGLLVFGGVALVAAGFSWRALSERSARPAEVARRPAVAPAVLPTDRVYPLPTPTPAAPGRARGGRGLRPGAAERRPRAHAHRPAELLGPCPGGRADRDQPRVERRRDGDPRGRGPDRPVGGQRRRDRPHRERPPGCVPRQVRRGQAQHRHHEAES